jgi:hypothetical protein
MLVAPSDDQENDGESYERDHAEEDPSPGPDLREEHDREQNPNQHGDDRDRRELHPIVLFHGSLGSVAIRS